MPVYFVQPVDGGPIKIGFSDDVPARLEQLEQAYGRPLKLLATIEGDRSLEYEIHGRFSHLRFGRREQFRPDEDLLSFIGVPFYASAVEVEEMPYVNQPDPSHVSVKLDVTVANRAKVVARLSGKTLVEYLSDTLAPIVEKDLAKALSKLKGTE